jgi:hypothetical protein
VGLVLPPRAGIRYLILFLVISTTDYCNRRVSGDSRLSSKNVPSSPDKLLGNSPVDSVSPNELLPLHLFGYNELKYMQLSIAEDKLTGDGRGCRAV